MQAFFARIGQQARGRYAFGPDERTRGICGIRSAAVMMPAVLPDGPELTVESRKTHGNNSRIE